MLHITGTAHGAVEEAVSRVTSLPSTGLLSLPVAYASLGHGVKILFQLSKHFKRPADRERQASLHLCYL